MLFWLLQAVGWGGVGSLMFLWGLTHLTPTLALANKECLVSAGDLFVEAVAKGGGRLIPVDSEHSAIFQALEDDQRHAVERIVLTASGGPFRTRDPATLAEMPEISADFKTITMRVKPGIYFAGEWGARV